MNAAMKAISVGGSVKSGLDKAGRLAAGAFGLATHDEVVTLRSTIQHLEDQVMTLESKAAKKLVRQARATGTPAPSRSGAPRLSEADVLGFARRPTAGASSIGRACCRLHRSR
jgi:hypothetical protein